MPLAAWRKVATYTHTHTHVKDATTPTSHTYLPVICACMRRIQCSAYEKFSWKQFTKVFPSKSAVRINILKIAGRMLRRRQQQQQQLQLQQSPAKATKALEIWFMNACLQVSTCMHTLTYLHIYTRVVTGALNLTWKFCLSLLDQYGIVEPFDLSDLLGDHLLSDR